jgi:predicted ferric reductase
MVVLEEMLKAEKGVSLVILLLILFHYLLMEAGSHGGSRGRLRAEVEED